MNFEGARSLNILHFYTTVVRQYELCGMYK